MLDDLGSYRLSDFLLFSQETYFRQFELYNRTWWPVLILLLAAGVVSLVLLARGASRRTPLMLCALMWAWIGWAFHLERYASIHIAAPYFAVLFAFEALMLAAAALGMRGREATLGAAAPTAAILFLAYAIVIHPFVGLAAGRMWSELSLFGMAPDPTAIGTLGVILAVGGRWKWLLLVPAIAWCMIAGVTAYAMDSIEALAPFLATALAVGLAVRGPRTTPATDPLAANRGRN